MQVQERKAKQEGDKARREEVKARLAEGLEACKRTGNTHAASEMGAMLEDLA